MPDSVVVACGLAAGVELERPLLRKLRAELRRAEALAAAGRVLRRRDVSRARLAERLEGAGVGSEMREHAAAALVEAGAVDDRRLAERLAHHLAEKGWGDEGIRARLAREGIGDEDVEAALEAVSPESERAALLIAGAVDPRKAWAQLARRGFDPDTATEAVAALDEVDSGGLG